MVKYASEMERVLHEEHPDLNYEPESITYTQTKRYTPDFKHPNLPKVWFEFKGRFRTSAEARIYKDVALCHPDMQIVFIFPNPMNNMPFAKKRKDGTKLTMGEWADNHGFKHCASDNFRFMLLQLIGEKEGYTK